MYHEVGRFYSLKKAIKGQILLLGVLLFIATHFVYDYYYGVSPASLHSNLNQPLVFSRKGPYPVNPEELIIAVMTSPQTLDRLWAVENTYARHTRVSVLYFMGNTSDPDVQALLQQNESPDSWEENQVVPRKHPFLDRQLKLPKKERFVILPNVQEAASHFITTKTIAMWKWMASNRPDAKWFMKCDDDTYVIPQNLMARLEELDWREPHFLGHLIYNQIASGGAGYLFSRGLIHLAVELIEECLKTPEFKESDGEDFVISFCLWRRRQIAVEHVDQLMIYLPRDSKIWAYWDTEFETYSEWPASIHYMQALDMYELDYMLYSLKVALREDDYSDRYTCQNCIDQ